MTLRELIQRAIDMAQPGVDPLARAVIELTVEPLLPVVFGKVGEELASLASTRHLLRRTKTVAVANGTVALTDDVLTVYACEASLFDHDDPNQLYSRTDWPDLLSGQLDSRLGHFLIDGQTLRVVAPNSQFDPDNGPSGDFRLFIPCSPEIPTIDAQVDVPAEVTDLLIERLAGALRAGFTK